MFFFYSNKSTNRRFECRRLCRDFLSRFVSDYCFFFFYDETRLENCLLCRSENWSVFFFYFLFFFLPLWKSLAHYFVIRDVKGVGFVSFDDKFELIGFSFLQERWNWRRNKFKNILKDYQSTIIGEKFAKETMLEITNFKFIEYLESSGNPDLCAHNYAFFWIEITVKIFIFLISIRIKNIPRSNVTISSWILEILEIKISEISKQSFDR